MRYRWIIFGFILFLMISGFLEMTGRAYANDTDPPWVSKIISLQGRAMVNRQDQAEWVQLQLNDALFPGDRIRVEANSRAGMVLKNDAVLRLDQHTTLVFTEIEQERTFIFKLLKGAANFFSRRPRSLKIFTPFVNGVVEGTEFFVRVDEDRTRIELFEGRILAENPYGEVKLERGQEVTASAGQAPQRSLLVHPRDSVAWALYYPPILSIGPDELPESLAESMTKFHDGRADEAIADLESLMEERTNPRVSTFEAGLLLYVGRIAEAESAIQQALSIDPDHSNALALRAIIAVVQNRKESALSAAQMAIQSDPRSAAAHIAHSYAQQAAFNLSGALDAANLATRQASESGMAWARLAELRLATGELGLGVEAARKAVAFNPRGSHAHTILGFAYLTQIKTELATEAFDEAILLDSAAPLPRLGLGLTKIRKGNLKQGRTEIEIAAGLDPSNALVRSYLGKAYFDEKRGPLDQRQLGIAKTLDPQDPTPWFYDAIRKQSLNQPVEALQDLQKSIQLNDNRAVYRSRLLLDKDRAARGASLARIYDNLGFKLRALVESTKSLTIDPTNYSAHRFLSDTYVQLPQRQIAQISERLQAQLLQPVNVNPVQPQLSIKGLNLVSGKGAGKAAFNEFTPLFERNRPQLTVAGIVGNKQTYGDEVVLSGIFDSYSYSLGQFHYQSDGFRENADIEHDIYNIFTQVAVTDMVNVQFEYRSRNTSRGDTRLDLDPDFVPNERRDLEQDTWRTGLHLSPSPSSDVLASIIYSDRREGVLNETSDLRRTISDDRGGYNAEAQYIFHERRFNIVFGGGVYRVDADIETRTITPGVILPPPLPPIPPGDNTERDAFEVNGENLYLYSNISFPKQFVWTLGLSYETYEKTDPYADLENVSPKIGVQWDVTERVRFRAAFVETLKRQLAVDQTIEPTQVAGFNQLFDDIDGTRAQLFGAALDVTLNNGLYAGLEFTRRDLAEASEREEERYRGYLYWAPHAHWSVGAACQFEQDDFRFDLETTTVPFTFSYFFPQGLFGQLGPTLVWQEKKEGATVLSDNFLVVDLAVGYRLPKRLGTISLEIGNLFGETFRYQDANFKTLDKFNVVQPFLPERTILAKVVLNF